MYKDETHEIIKSLTDIYVYTPITFVFHFRRNVYGIGKVTILKQLLNTFSISQDKIDFIKLQIEFDKQTFVKRMKNLDTTALNGKKYRVMSIGFKANKKKLYRWFRQNQNRFLLKHEFVK